MRVIVTGSRDWSDRWAVWSALDDLYDLHGPFTVVHGGCPTGADEMANDWALLRRMLIHIFRADWKKWGSRAGPLRNEQMVKAGADVVLAFSRNRSRGTRDCIRRAREAGVDVIVREVNDE